MEQEFREVRRVLRRAIQLGRDARNRISSPLSSIPVQALYAASFVATISVLLHAYITHEQFYPAVTFLMSSKLSLMVLDIQFLVLAYLFLRAIIWIFFGPLTAVERMELYEKSWYDVLDCLMLATMVKGEITHIFALEIMALIMTKALIFVTGLRVDGQAVALGTSLLTHTRMTAAILTSVGTSLYLGKHAMAGIISTGSTHHIVLGVEHAIASSTLFYISFKYSMLMYSRRNPEFYRKDEYLKAAEVMNYFVHLICNLMMISYFSLYDMLPLFLLKNVYHSLKDFTQSFDTWRRARNAVQAVESSLFDITNDELAALEDRTCAICRDEMTTSTRQKRLTCGHCFHAQCVRDWFQRSPSCPTCRAEVITRTNRQTRMGPRRRLVVGTENGNTRLPPEVVDMLHQLAEMADDAVRTGNTDNLGRLDDTDVTRHGGPAGPAYNVQIQVAQHSYTTSAGGTPAPTPPPVPRAILDSMDIQELMNLADNMTQSLQIRNDWTRTMHASLLSDQRSIIGGIDEVQNIIAQIFARISEVRQGDLQSEELDQLSQRTERLRQLVQDVERISNSAEETALRGFASSTRTVGTQCPPRSPSSSVGRLFSDGELNRRRILAQRNLIDMGRPIGRSVSDDTFPTEFRPRPRLFTGPAPPSVWSTYASPPTFTPPPTVYDSSVGGPSVENREEPSSIWSGDSPGGFSQETFAPTFNSNSEAASFGPVDEAQERLRQRRIARFMMEE